MVGIAQLDRVLVPVVEWARSRPDVLGLALVGSWARGEALPNSDIDLIVLGSQPQTFRDGDRWLAEIHWTEGRAVSWHDADYGTAWSRHVRLEPPCEIEFTFCGPSWAATDPVDPGTANVLSNGCRVVLDKAQLFGKLLAVAAP
jgi:predicted nucleotidyltransferase